MPDTTGDGQLVDRTSERAWMVQHQLVRRGVRDRAVLDAFLAVPREAFVGSADQAAAYDDRPLPIGAGQTISQPYVVAVMIEALALRRGDRVLEVGAGSGYAAALLGRLAARVVALERWPDLAAAATTRLRRLGIGDVQVVAADGSLGWPAGAPFDAILVSAAGATVPPALLEQLAPGGRLVIPVGGAPEQRLLRLTRAPGEDSELGAGSEPDVDVAREDLGPVSFVPLLAGVEPGGSNGPHDGPGGPDR